MASANVEILHEAKQKMDSEWWLCFQHCLYHYDNGECQEGYRFIWRRPNKSLQVARGQARLPTISIILKLVSIAMSEGWGNINGEYTGYDFPETEKMD